MIKSHFAEVLNDRKDFRDAGPEIERLGQQIDNARSAAEDARAEWAKTFWQTTEDRLLKRWQQTIVLRDASMSQQTRYSGFTIDYEWFESSQEPAGAMPEWFDNLFYAAGVSRGLESTWANAKEEKLQKARQGLA
jgi:hypothetical protein